MSKTQLKKELKELDAPQLRELILEVYEARKEAREYFEFFLAPDADKLYQRYVTLIDKELLRSKRGMLSARFTRVRAFIKDFASFGPGADYVLRLMQHTLSVAVVAERAYHTKPPFENGILRLAADTLTYADRHLLFDSALKSVTEITDTQASRHLAPALRDVIEQHMGQ